MTGRAAGRCGAVLVALAFALHNLCTPGKARAHNTILAVLVAALAWQLNGACSRILVGLPLLSVLLGQALQLALTPWPCSAAAWRRRP